MPCSDSSSSINLVLDQNEKFVSFDFAKITCGREIKADTGYQTYCRGKTLGEILKIPFNQAVSDLKLEEEEAQFVFYLEWDALRSVIAEYLGNDALEIDVDRCHITSIVHSKNQIEVALVILPPKELPKILPCSIMDKP